MHSKCFTDLSLARDFGVEVGAKVTSSRQGVERRSKRGADHPLCS